VGDAWLRVNIRLPDPELVAILEKRCARFGTVKFIRLLPIASDNLHRFAFVHMSTLTENMDLAAAAGGSTLAMAQLLCAWRLIPERLVCTIRFLE